MTDDLSLLPEELRRNVEHVDFNRNPIAWSFVRAELLRLARENAEMCEELLHVPSRSEWSDVHLRSERAEAELAKLRARIDAAPVVRAELVNKMGGVRCNGLPIEWVGQRVRLVRVEDES